MSRPSILKALGGLLIAALLVTAALVAWEARQRAAADGALQSVRLAALPPSAAYTVRETGWRTLEIEFRASRPHVQQWVAASPGLRGVPRVVVTGGATQYALSLPDAPEPTTVRVASDGLSVRVSVSEPCPGCSESEF